MLGKSSNNYISLYAEHMQAKIDLLESKEDVVANLSHSQDNETKWEEIKSKITDAQTIHETDFLALSRNLSKLKEEANIRRSTIYDHDTRLTQLELDNADCLCNNTTIQDYDTRILRLEADNVDNDNAFRAKIQTHTLALSNSITELKIEIATHESSILDHNTRLKQLELDNADCTCNETITQGIDIRILQLEEDTVAIGQEIQALGVKTTQLELVRTESDKIVQTLNSTIEQLDFNIFSNEGKIALEHTKVEHLEFESTMNHVAIQNLNESIVTLGFYRTLDQVVFQNMNTSITNLDLEETLTGADIETLNISITGLEINSTQHRADMQDILTSISEIESNIELNRAFKIMFNDSFTELQVDFSAQTQAINDQIRSLIQTKEDVEENGYSVQNITDMLSVFNTEREMGTAVIDDINEKLSKLALDINATKDLHHHMELRVSYLEGNIPFFIL